MPWTKNGSVALTTKQLSQLLWRHSTLNLKGMRFPVEVILSCIRWYAAYPLSYSHIEELMEERGVSFDR